MYKSSIVRLSLFVMSLFGISMLAAQEQEAQTAGEYYQSLFKDTEGIQDQTWRYMTYAAHDQANDESQRVILKKMIASALERTRKFPDFKGDNALREAVQKYYIFKLDMMDGKALEMENMRKMAQESYDAMEAYIFFKRKIERQSEQEFDKLNRALENFAKNHGFNLMEAESDETSDKIELANRVFNHKEMMFLSYFRCQIFESQMIDAYQNGDLDFSYTAAGVKLAGLAEISKQALDTISTINNDYSLRRVTRDALDFYAEEGRELAPALQENRLIKKEFDDFKLSFEAIPEEQLTQQDVDRYNDWVKRVNTSSQDVSNLIAKYNAERSNIHEKWNRTASEFVQRHIPNEVQAGGKMASL